MTPARRLVDMAEGVFDHETGALLEITTSHKAWQIRHACGQWTWEQANFCIACGRPLDVQLGDPELRGA